MTVFYKLVTWISILLFFLLIILTIIYPVIYRVNPKINSFFKKLKLKYILIGLGIYILLIIVFIPESKDAKDPQELVNNSQLFDLSKSQYCDNPFSAFGQNKVKSLGLTPTKDKYGEFEDNIAGWVYFKNVKLIIPPGGKSVSALEIPFYYYAKNCWGNTEREGSVDILIATSAIDAIIKYSNLGDEYLTQSKEGDLFDVFVKSPDIDIYTPKHACDVTYATISNPQDVFIKKIN
jgi:hypothetical protein